jgi:hypothetical protein
MCLIFWDSQDNFTFEKKISISHIVSEHQNQIYFIDYLNMWVTSDNTNSIYGWDINKEKETFKIRKQLKNHVIDIVELAYIKKVAVGCVDRTL